MPYNFDEIEGVQVMLERNAALLPVGVLKFRQGLFQFEYHDAYLRSQKAIPLGPEMPLSRKYFQSKDLFRPFSERIPSKENPAYVEYCAQAGISDKETNPLVLLSTIASRGPSSFIFKPIYLEEFTAEDLKNFRLLLGFTVREFALCFDFSQPGITRVETGKSDGREILKRAQIYAKYPEVALDQLRLRSAFINKEKLERARSRIQAI